MDSSQLSISLWTTISSTNPGSYSLVSKSGMISIGYDVSCLLLICTRTVRSYSSGHAPLCLTM
jgi:hypothetical protein